MKALLLVCLILASAGCSTSPSPSTLSQTTMDRESLAERNSRMQGSAAIDSRAKYYEKSGLSPDDARAAAEIEYAKSGR